MCDLAGLQPRRAQILDLIGWYERQLTKLGVEIRLNTYLEAEEIAAMDVARVVLATGAQPDASGFQKALPHIASLTGAERGDVATVEDVMSRAVRPGQNVVLLDEGGHWRGVGTAWHLAEAGHAVSIVTPDAMIAQGLARMACDATARSDLARLGVAFLTEHAIREWTGRVARCRSLLSGAVHDIEADMLVLATGRRVDGTIAEGLRGLGVSPVVIGDALAPRQAAAAIHDGRCAALAM